MGEQKRRYQSRNDVVRTLITDDSNPKVAVVHTLQDLTPLLKELELARDVPQRGPNRRLASVPLIVWEDLERRGITDDPNGPEMKKWLNSSEAAPWRDWRGKV